VPSTSGDDPCIITPDGSESHDIDHSRKRSNAMSLTPENGEQEVKKW